MAKQQKRTGQQSPDADAASYQIEVLPPLTSEPDGSRAALVRALAMMLIELATIPVEVPSAGGRNNDSFKVDVTS